SDLARFWQPPEPHARKTEKELAGLQEGGARGALSEPPSKSGPVRPVPHPRDRRRDPAAGRRRGASLHSGPRNPADRFRRGADRGAVFVAGEAAGPARTGSAPPRAQGQIALEEGCSAPESGDRFGRRSRGGRRDLRRVPRLPQEIGRRISRTPPCPATITSEA